MLLSCWRGLCLWEGGVRAAASPPVPTQLWPRARGPTACSPPWLRLLPAGQPAAREGVWWPGTAGQRAGPGPPAPHLPGSRPGPGPVLSDNGRQLGAGAGSEGEGAQVSEGCGVGEGRMGRAPLEQKQKGHRAPQSCKEKSLGEEPRGPSPPARGRQPCPFNENHPILTTSSPGGWQGFAKMNQERG